MFGIGVPELILVAIVALLVVGPKRLPITLRAIGRAIGEFRRASHELRAEVGFDQVVDEVTRPLREGIAGIEADVLKTNDDHGNGTGREYPEGGPDDYGAIPEGNYVYPEVVSVYESSTHAEHESEHGTVDFTARPEGTVARGRIDEADEPASSTPATTPARPESH